jgi:hypothetical protein
MKKRTRIAYLELKKQEEFENSTKIGSSRASID